MNLVHDNQMMLRLQVFVTITWCALPVEPAGCGVLSGDANPATDVTFAPTATQMTNTTSDTNSYESTTLAIVGTCAWPLYTFYFVSIACQCSCQNRTTIYFLCLFSLWV